MFDAHVFTVISPINGEAIYRRPFASAQVVEHTLNRANQAYNGWKTTPLAERVRLLELLVKSIEGHQDEIANELTTQMGRPIRYTKGEIAGFASRARHMLHLAPIQLADRPVTEPASPKKLKRYLRREALGIVLVVTAWNYPYLVAVNSLIPALVAGNCVVLKGSPQTPSCVERLYQAAKEAGLPDGVLQYLHLSNDSTLKLVHNPLISRVQFTGSVEGGRAIQKAASARFIGVGLELGGKDAAYVLSDCDLDYSVEQLVDGSFFNSGQSCCGIERIYVDAVIYDSFVDKFVQLTKEYKLGDPRDPNTTLGPVVSVRSADKIRAHIDEAVARGANAMIDTKLFPLDQPGSNYLTPQVLTNVDHTMAVMVDETFGPVVGIMKVNNEDEALSLIHDSPYGLTASIWTKNLEKAEELAAKLEVGTVFVNRCDYLDPGCAWTGCKDSGRGVTLSEFGFDAVTRIKSVHILEQQQ